MKTFNVELTADEVHLLKRLYNFGISRIPMDSVPVGSHLGSKLDELETLAEAQSVEVQNDFMGEVLKGI